MQCVNAIFLSCALAGTFGFSLGFWVRGNGSVSPVVAIAKSAVQMQEVREPEPFLKKMYSSSEPAATPQTTVNYMMEQLAELQPDLYCAMRAATESKLQRALFKELSNADPVQAAALLQEEMDEEHWLVLADQLLRSWANKDARSAYDWFQKVQTRFSDKQESYLNKFVLSRLAEQEPAYTRGMLDTIWDQGIKESLVLGMAQSWVQQDPEAAFDWLESLAEDPSLSASTLNSCYVASMKQYIDMDPDAAADVILQLKSEKLLQELVEPMVDKFASIDLINSMVWVLQLQNAAARKQGVEEIIRNYADSDPDLVLEYMLTTATPSSDSIDLLGTVFSEIFDVDSGRAIARLAEVPEYAESRVVDSIAVRWLEQDESAALNWIYSLPPGEAADTAAAKVSQYFADRQPDVALLWANSIVDDALRIEQLNRLVSEVPSSDLASVQKAIGEFDLSCEENAEIQQLLNQRIRNAFPELIIP